MTLSDPEPISPQHQVESFRCGQAELDEWLVKHALPSHRADSARTYVTCDGAEVKGYYSLTSGAVRPSAATARVAKGVGQHDIPVVVLARLAVDHGYQNAGVGRSLVKDALLRVTAAADVIGIRAVLVHMKTPELKEYYARFGFEQSPAEDAQMFLLMKDLRKAIADAKG